MLGKGVKTVISTPFARQSLTFLGPLLFFADEFWFYVYHNRNYTNLLITATFFQALM